MCHFCHCQFCLKENFKRESLIQNIALGDLPCLILDWEKILNNSRFSGVNRIFLMVLSQIRMDNCIK